MAHLDRRRTSDDELAPLLPPEGKVVAEHINPDDVSPLKKKLLVLCIFLGAYLSSLDLTIVATCIPNISSELKLSNQGSWIGTSYLWSTVTFTPLYGRLSDIIGRRNAYLQAMTLFGLGTALCGVAPSLLTLSVARFIAGMGGGGVGTVGSVVIADIFPPRDRGIYQSVFYVGFATGMGSGGPIGGVVTKYLGWHAAFYIQLPLVALCFFIATTCIPRARASSFSLRVLLERVDLLGSLSLLLSIGSLLLALSLNANSQISLPDLRLIATLVAFVLFFLVFIYVELRVAKEPVLPLELLTRRTALCVGVISGVVAVVNFSMVYLVPTLYEIVYEQSLSEAGLHLVPNAAAMIVGAPTAGFIVRKTGYFKWLTVACCFGPVVSQTWLAFLSRDAVISQWLCVLPMGLGFSGLLTSTILALLADVDKKQIATATGFVFVWRSLGQVLGVGLSQAIFQDTLARELAIRISDKEAVQQLRHSMESIYSLPADLQALAREAFQAASRQAFLFSAGMATVALITALFLPNKKIPSEDEVIDVSVE